MCRTRLIVDCMRIHWRVDWWARIGGQMNPWMELARTMCLAWVGGAVVMVLLVIWLCGKAPYDTELWPREDEDERG